MLYVVLHKAKINDTANFKLQKSGILLHTLSTLFTVLHISIIYIN